MLSTHQKGRREYPSSKNIRKTGDAGESDGGIGRRHCNSARQGSGEKNHYASGEGNSVKRRFSAPEGKDLRYGRERDTVETRSYDHRGGEREGRCGGGKAEKVYEGGAQRAKKGVRQWAVLKCLKSYTRKDRFVHGIYRYGQKKVTRKSLQSSKAGPVAWLQSANRGRQGMGQQRLV